MLMIQLLHSDGKQHGVHVVEAVCAIVPILVHQERRRRHLLLVGLEPGSRYHQNPKRIL